MAMDGVLRLYFGESNHADAAVHQATPPARLADGFTFYTEKRRTALAAHARSPAHYRACTTSSSTRTAKLSSPAPACRR